MVPDHYALIWTEETRRIFVLISGTVGDLVLTTECKGPGCGCIGCALETAVIGIEGTEFPILEAGTSQVLGENLTALAFTEEGGLFVHSLKLDRYRSYKGTVDKSRLDRLFRVPTALVVVKSEDDGTYTHSYVSDSVGRQVISRGCRAGPYCPCVGCKIVDMVYLDHSGEMKPAVDLTEPRSSPAGELLLPIYEGDEILSAMLLRDPAIRHDFSPGLFDSPLERMFYELAFLDLHLYPQHPVGRYRLDFAIPDKRVAIELDGHDHHKTRYQRTHDARRDRWLFGQGWHVLRFTGTEIHQNLDRCIDEICVLVGVERLSRVRPET